MPFDENSLQEVVSTAIGSYGWVAVSALILFMFRTTIENTIAGLMIFIGNNYNEDDVVEIDGKPGRIVRVGMWKTVFFLYHIHNGKVVSGEKLVVQNDKLKDLKISKPLPELDLRKYQTNPVWGRRSEDKDRRQTGRKVDV